MFISLTGHRIIPLGQKLSLCLPSTHRPSRHILGMGVRRVDELSGRLAQWSLKSQLELNNSSFLVVYMCFCKNAHILEWTLGRVLHTN